MNCCSRNGEKCPVVAYCYQAPEIYNESERKRINCQYKDELVELAIETSYLSQSGERNE